MVFGRTCHAVDLSISCDKVSNTIQSNADITGLGVFLGFAIQSGLAVALSLCLIYLDWKHRDAHVKMRRRTALALFIFALGDTQMITCVVVILAGIIELCSLTVYHYKAVVEYAGMALGAHILGMLAIRPHIIRNEGRKKLIYMRFRAVLAFGVTVLFIAWMFGTLDMDDNVLSLPAGCFFPTSESKGGNSTVTTRDNVKPDGNESAKNSTIPAILFVTTGLGALFNFSVYISNVAELFPEDHVLKYIMRSFYALPTVAFGVSLISLIIRKWTHGVRVRPPTIPATAELVNNRFFVSDNSEFAWGFGQLLPVFLLVLVLASYIDQQCSDGIGDTYCNDEEATKVKSRSTKHGLRK